MQKNVEFYSEGSLIKGILHLPENLDENRKHPAIVLCHGFAGVKELLLPNFAKRFSENGFIVLSFDYRGFGESEGERGRLLPKNQITDIRNAITFLQSIVEVDSQRIGLWGTSFGGANAIITSSIDKRVKCLSVQITFGNGERVITGGMSEEEKSKFYDSITKMCIRAVTKNKEMMVTVDKVLTDEQSKEFYFSHVEEFPALKTKIPFLTVKETIEHKAENHIGSVNIPILIVGAENDAVNPIEESTILFEKANEPKELLIVKGATHYDLYEGEKFEEVSNKQIEWFSRYLA
ncbi:MAG: alpha/beta fold hydrolase [Clostridia bacterium]|nr:alpha/beta fold hydrolase [Clostridia bacterium]